VGNLKIAVQLTSFRLPFKKALLTAARLGAQAVEIDGRQHVRHEDLSGTGLRQVRKMLDDLNLRVSAVRFRTRRGYQVEDDLERRVAATKDAMSMAYKLGASVVVNQVGMVPAEGEDEQGWALMYDALHDLGRHAQQAGAWLSAETGSESGADLLRLVKALPEGSLGVTFNPGNLIIHGFSAHDALEQLGEHVMYVHAKDAIRDLAIGRGLEVPLGRGTADIPNLVGVLAERGYRGYFAVERENAENPVEEMGMAVEYLASL
jgi:sugar phosphate isomerase/epimerase